MPRSKPPFNPDDRVAIVGAGAAGVHMASLLKKRGYGDVTVFEKTNRIGGKSRSHFCEGALFELGTCFMHCGYHRVKRLLSDYGMRAEIPPVGRAIFSGSNSRPVELKDFILTEVADAIRADGSRWFPRSTRATLLWSIWRYCRLHQKIFGPRRRYATPDRPSSETAASLARPFSGFLKDYDLLALTGVLRIAQAAQGYGYLESIPAYYGLRWATPDFMKGLLKQSLGISITTRMIPDGFESLWTRMASRDNLRIELGRSVHRIERSESGKILLETQKEDGHVHRDEFDFVVLTVNLKAALSTLAEPTEEEQRVLSSLQGFTLTTTLYESDPIPGYSTPESDKALAYFPDVLEPGRDGEWYADGNHSQVFSAVNDTPRRYDRQLRVAYQFSAGLEEQRVPTVPPFPRDERLADQLAESWRRFGVGNPRILQQYSWPYFMHFPSWAIERGYPWDLFDMQGHRGVWYAGASACFESVHDVVDYNHQLVEHFLPKGPLKVGSVGASSQRRPEPSNQSTR